MKDKNDRVQYPHLFIIFIKEVTDHIPYLSQL